MRTLVFSSHPHSSKVQGSSALIAKLQSLNQRNIQIYCKNEHVSRANASLLTQVYDERHEHQELSEGCLFFEPTHHIRAAKNRRDTVDSTKSSESFKTANSELEVKYVQKRSWLM